EVVVALDDVRELFDEAVVALGVDVEGDALDRLSVVVDLDLAADFLAGELGVRDHGELGQLGLGLHGLVEARDQVDLYVAVEEDAELAAPLVDVLAVVLDAEDELATDRGQVSEELLGPFFPELPELLQGEDVAVHVCFVPPESFW